MLFTTLCSTIAAQEIDSLRHLDIEGVVVFGNKINKETIPVQVLGGEELKRLSAHSVADAVRYFSGVQIKDYGGIGGLKTINVRSMGSNHVGVFFDGVQIGNAQNGVVDLGRFSLDNMETVSMYNGQKSAIFQSAKDYASASAIYMTTRKPKFESGKDYNFNLGLKGGSFKTINPSVLWEQRLSKSIRSSVSAEYMYTSGEYPFTYTKEDGYNVTETRENGDIRYFRAEAALF
ncbi:MAG: Plug domain-containing protein, partial [Rikenellaceae bacterium]